MFNTSLISHSVLQETLGTIHGQMSQSSVALHMELQNPLIQLIIRLNEAYIPEVPKPISTGCEVR